MSSLDAPGLPLRQGDHGPAVRDLHQRLGSAGFRDVGELDSFDDHTEKALREFQASRKLVEDGICARQTWTALVDADHRLGDRMIYLRSPMTRGDDVTDLQHQLGSLGFDAGWLDGIFGPDTERALRDFQHNQGLTADGVVGRETVAALQRLAGRPAGRSAGERTVAEVRDLEQLRNHTGVFGQRIIIGESGGMPAIADALARRLRLDGADVLTLHQPDLSDQARAANGWDGSVYVGLTLADSGHQVSYFEIDGFTSHGGRALAHHCGAALTAVLGTEITSQGMRLPILRETRMPAVWCRMGPPTSVVEQAAAVTDALREAIATWCVDSGDSPASSTG
ncbi:MAG: peptidoglycan-binding protein [Acidimicrobiales bacterium]|jgi:N-acetylmuramoyl-L-alanine amidase|nr:peptidoglycan-binding protein [Acidimicrobiales bacterium]